MNIKKHVKIAALLMAAILLIGQLTCLFVSAEDETADSGASGKTVIIAGSDFQAKKGAEYGAQTVTSILASMTANGGITAADGFLFCGDYSQSENDYADNIKGVEALRAAVSPLVANRENMILVQGNHDCKIGVGGMAQSGNNDPESGKYGVFVINEDDYMWKNEDKQKIIETSESLKEYLDKKAQESFGAPIFVVSHLPLHVTMRTKSIGDGKYASYIFDVLNEAGKKGLNIVFLFGHDHGDGWDDYLGGGAIYLAKGDKITIAHGSMSTLTTETLSFYYLNAGYVGYYAECNDGADTTLTMTAFVFDENTLEISRYDAKGVHTLKSAGVINSYKDEDKENRYSANTDVYQSPQIIELSVPVIPEETETETEIVTETETEIETESETEVETETEIESETETEVETETEMESDTTVTEPDTTDDSEAAPPEDDGNSPIGKILIPVAAVAAVAAAGAAVAVVLKKRKKTK